MKAIVAVDKNWGIGKDGKLLVHLPGDLKFFKEKTLGQTVIMGRTTLEGLPGGKALPDRTTIVLSSNKRYKRDDAIVMNNIGNMMLALDYYGTTDEVFVCGGAFVYHELLEACDSVFVTKINDEYDADAFFPNLDNQDDMEIVWESPVQNENGVEYQWVEYARKREDSIKENG